MYLRKSAERYMNDSGKGIEAERERECGGESEREKDREKGKDKKREKGKDRERM